MSLQSFLFPEPPVSFLQQISVPALAAGEIKDYDQENTLRHYRKFMPFSNIQLVNTSAVDVEVVLDYSTIRKLLVLAGGTKALRNQPFSSFSVKNKDVSVATAAGELMIELETIR
jgi:hypothetical protein